MAGSHITRQINSRLAAPDTPFGRAVVCGVSCPGAVTNPEERVKLAFFEVKMMNSAKDLEKAVASLSDPELKEFRAWFTEFDSKNWDAQIETDIAAGKLENLGEKALERHLSKETSEM